jgi:hypothetical protein
MQTDRQPLLLEKFALPCLYSTSSLHKLGSFPLRFERVDDWEHIASRWRLACSSHL